VNYSEVIKFTSYFNAHVLAEIEVA